MGWSNRGRRGECWSHPRVWDARGTGNLLEWISAGRGELNKMLVSSRSLSSLGVGGLHPAGGVWGRQGVLRVTSAPAVPPGSQLLPAPSTAGLACCLACMSWITPSSCPGACSLPLGIPSFRLSVPLTIGPSALLMPAHPGLPAGDCHARGVQRGGWAGAPGAGSQAPTLRAQPTPDLTQGSF